MQNCWLQQTLPPNCWLKSVLPANFTTRMLRITCFSPEYSRHPASGIVRRRRGSMHANTLRAAVCGTISLWMNFSTHFRDWRMRIRLGFAYASAMYSLSWSASSCIRYGKETRHAVHQWLDSAAAIHPEGALAYLA